MALAPEKANRMQVLHASVSAINFVALIQLTGRSDLTAWLHVAVVLHALAIPLALVIAFGRMHEPAPPSKRKFGDPVAWDVRHGFTAVWGVSMLLTWMAVECIFLHFSNLAGATFAITSLVAFFAWSRLLRDPPPTI